MDFVKERLATWIYGLIILVIGILCIVAGAKMGGDDLGAAADALDGISIILGIVLIVVGSLSLILSVAFALLAKKGFVLVALPGAVFLALGISLVVAKYAANLIGIILTIIPYLLIVLGAVILAGLVYRLVLAIKAKEKTPAIVGLSVAMAIAIAAIVLGALCVGNDPVIKAHIQLIVFGIIVALTGVFQITATFVKVPDVVVIAKEEK